MKLFASIAAAAVAVSVLIPAAASAQEHRVVAHKVVIKHRAPARTVCNTVVQHGHRNRVCHTVR